MARIKLGFDEFGWDALGRTANRHSLGYGELVGAACRRQISSAQSAPVAPPRFSRPGRGRSAREITIDLQPAELLALEREAERERVNLEVLVRHAVIALLADIESGRVGREVLSEEEASAGASG